MHLYTIKETKEIRVLDFQGMHITYLGKMAGSLTEQNLDDYVETEDDASFLLKTVCRYSRSADVKKKLWGMIA